MVLDVVLFVVQTCRYLADECDVAFPAASGDDDGGDVAAAVRAGQELEERKRKHMESKLASRTTFVVAFRDLFGLKYHKESGQPRVKVGKSTATHRSGKGGCGDCRDLAVKLASRGLSLREREEVKLELEAHWKYVRKQR